MGLKGLRSCYVLNLRLSAPTLSSKAIQGQWIFMGKGGQLGNQYSKGFLKLSQEKRTFLFGKDLTKLAAICISGLPTQYFKASPAPVLHSNLFQDVPRYP